ncbi:tubulin polyglutamylase ttll6-like isoform X2 [Lepisosteus oculatus]|uniref:tubulin polyglutamylase ttll6-like isoform X2 n=1 Tax=Lepisosteus oculatus TaxID=7918 RepID=UPI0007402EAE|nr:PREDICTED: tubulin polyglutamylase ttll6-like isoform X2 [Lepisosteus oculatus]
MNSGSGAESEAGEESGKEEEEEDGDSLVQGSGGERSGVPEEERPQRSLGAGAEAQEDPRTGERGEESPRDEQGQTPVKRPGGDHSSPTSDSHRKIKKRKKSRSLGINLSNCKYESVRRAAQAVGLREASEKEDWIVCWTDFSVSMERVKDMKRYQKINHFPGMSEICRKDLLARNMNRMLKLFPKDYNIFPKTWCLPSDYVDFQAYCRAKRNKTFICKPDSGCQGKGIYITRNLRDINPDEHIVCQSYISKPFIIDGYKFDLRLYVLVTSCDPLRVFLYQEGLVRFATSRYSHPHSSNLDDICMHLTNYAINKHNDNFIRDEETGSKRKLSTLKEWLELHCYDIQALWSNMEDVIIKTLISAHPILKHNYCTGFPNQLGPSSCFEILGFDILLDSKLKPWLLEVNHSPSFTTDSELDRQVKEALLTDTLRLLNLGVNDRRRLLEEDKRRAKERLLQKHQPPCRSRRELFLSTQASWLAEQEKHEEQHSGAFCRIYPRIDSEKYDKFLQHSVSLFQETVASKAREECARKMLEELQVKQELGGRIPLPGKRGGRGQQGESSGERAINRRITQHTAPSICPNPVSRPFLGQGQEASWDSFSPGLVVEEEEAERLQGLEQRESLLRGLGVVELVYCLLQAGNMYSIPREIVKQHNLDSPRRRKASCCIPSPAAAPAQWLPASRPVQQGPAA